MRPQANEMPGVPLVFWWESPDGSRGLTGRIYDYEDHPKNHATNANNLFQAGLDHAMFWFGVGDHGGGPTKENIQAILALKSNPALPELRFSTLREFFTAVEQS